MDKLLIRGGRPLNGTVEISGAKNAALPLMAATLLTPGWHTLENVPDLRDTRTMLRVLETLGAKYTREGSQVRINTAHLSGAEAPYELVKTMRASVLVLGPLLARAGYARVSLPGGCAIGARPVNYHLQGFEQLGVRTELEQGYVEARVEGYMQGATVYFDTPSVTATENLLMASVKARGVTVLKNAAREPEVGNLIEMLRSMGAEIEGDGSDELTIRGVEHLTPARASIVDDRIETGTYLIAVAATGGEAEIKGCIPAHNSALVEKLQQAGVIVRQGENSFHVVCPWGDAGNTCQLQSVDVRTLPYPGFPTDLQAQFMALMVLAEGTAIITESIFENRFMHVAELQRLGADITIDKSSAIVRGVGRERLCGAPVMATDLRASASLVIAGLAASGVTEVLRVYHLERGYEHMVDKLQALGADIEKVRAE
ncbi:MAG: UDP-N-acetylglucosamine 1-carboxyvinyltransferase [Desulfobulbus propionicus]|nr:MAG: UDP-N-acetylglucosamine 1-carboxyvinyltransferase [Desulfobulbus propionicus]